MILFDSDLDPDPAPTASAVKRHAHSGFTMTSRHLRVPSARVLTGFLANARSALRLQGQVNVLLTTDGAIRSLNRRFRRKNKATDVLSFPADRTAPGAERLAGDLAISVPTARRQAAEQGHALAVEVKILILHGLLHLAGYDHETDAGQMARHERLLRSRLGLPQGLIERAGLPTRAPQKSRKDAAQSDNRARNTDRARRIVRSQAKLKNKGAPNLSASSGQALGRPVRTVNRQAGARTKQP
jgi:probable rRNA maturation factor